MLHKKNAFSRSSAFMLTALLGFTSSFSSTSAQDVSLDAVRQAFNAANIPTDANIKFDPQTLLDVSFTQPGSNPVYVTAGSTLLQSALALTPVFTDSFAGAKSQFDSVSFVIAMVDLDAPTPQNRSLSQVRHFLGADFTIGQASDGSVFFSNSTPALSEYVQPSPPAGSDPHRYLFLLYTQPSTYSAPAASELVNAATPITNFDISAFAAAMGLGDPIGGTFMLVGPAGSGSGSGPEISSLSVEGSGSGSGPRTCKRRRRS